MRSLVTTLHKLVFGDGEDGAEQYVENTVTGEFNWVEDNGLNYRMTCFIAPKDTAGFTRPALSA